MAADEIALADVPAVVRRKLDRLCKQSRELSEESRSADEARKVINGEVMDLFEKHGLAKVRGRSWLAYIGVRANRKIDTKLLLKHGVPADVIAKCTVDNPSTFLTVTVNKQGKED